MSPKMQLSWWTCKSYFYVNKNCSYCIFHLVHGFQPAKHNHHQHHHKWWFIMNEIREIQTQWMMHGSISAHTQNTGMGYVQDDDDLQDPVTLHTSDRCSAHRRLHHHHTTHTSGRHRARPRVYVTISASSYFSTTSFSFWFGHLSLSQSWGRHRARQLP